MNNNAKTKDLDREKKIYLCKMENHNSVAQTYDQQNLKIRSSIVTYSPGFLKENS